ncbi:hypothetical protein FRC05_005421 [Tulasnella sp. 425]|nr:hypothetical protein FRC05_005421 [Tulasnella sp. 425]
MRSIQGSETPSGTSKSSPNRRNSSQSSPVAKRLMTDTPSTNLHPLQLLTLSDALQDLIENDTSRKVSSGSIPSLPAVPTSSWVADLTEVNEPSLTPIQPWWKTSFPNFDDRLHRKWSGSWEPLPLSQASDPVAGILKNPISPTSLPPLGRRISLGVDGFSPITKVNTESNQGDGPMALQVRQNENVGWDAATEVDSENGSVGGDDDFPPMIDPDEEAVESVLGIKRRSDWDADDLRIPPPKRPRMDAFLSSRPAFVSAVPLSRDEVANPASQPSNLETQSSTQAEPPRPVKVIFGPDPDGHPHRTKAKSMSTQHRKKQAEKRRKASKAVASPLSSTGEQSPSSTREAEGLSRPRKPELKAKEERHFLIRDRVYERVGVLLEMYENRVLLNRGLDLREVRRRYTLQPWNPNRKKRAVQRADGAWRTLDGPEQWKLCTPAIGEYVRIAYPSEDHPAWSAVDPGALMRWKESEEYVYRRTGECELGIDDSEIAYARERSSQMNVDSFSTEWSAAVEEHLEMETTTEEVRGIDASNASQIPEPPILPPQPVRRSTRTTTTATLPSSRKPTRVTRSSSVGIKPPTLLRRHSSENPSSRPTRSTRSRTRARSTITPLPQTQSRRLRSMAPPT